MHKKPTAPSTWTGNTSEQLPDGQGAPGKQQTVAPDTGSPLTDLPQRASTVTPLLADILARVEGVARWGINE